MTESNSNIAANSSSTEHQRLSIQIGLNGLSFCLMDTITKEVLKADSLSFPDALTPYDTQKKLQELLQENELENRAVSDVRAVHHNNLFSLVPKALFNESELPNYLKFNVKLLANDQVVYDELEGMDIYNTYVPFTNINNYLYGLYGAFEYRHHSTILVQNLLKTQLTGNNPICYVHSLQQQMDITVIHGKKLLFHNSFPYGTPEDFVYYLLFALEQLNLDTAQVPVRFFGDMEETDDHYRICSDYIANLSLYIPDNPWISQEQIEEHQLQYSLINA